jgi:hypothetical protein
VWGGPQRDVAVGSAPQPRAERQPMGVPQVMNEARGDVRTVGTSPGPSADANSARGPGNGSRNEDEWAKRRRGGGGGDNNNNR